MRQVVGLILFIAIVAGSMPSKALAASADLLRLAIPSDSVQSRMTAIGFGSLAKLRDTGFEIDTVWARTDDDVLNSLAADEADLAIVGLDAIVSEELQDNPDLRGVMKYWTSGDGAAESADDPNDGYMLLAKASVPDDSVDAFLASVLEDQITLKTVGVDIDKLTPEAALSELPVTAHDGVKSYLRREGIELSAATDFVPEQKGTREAVSITVLPRLKPDVAVSRGVNVDEDEEKFSRPHRTFTLFFDTAKASIDKKGFKSVAAACEFAGTLPRARFVISGHTDTVGSDTFNDALSGQRADAVANAIRNDPRFRDALSVVEFGEQKLAVATADGVAEPKNRRVEITVIED